MLLYFIGTFQKTFNYIVIFNGKNKLHSIQFPKSEFIFNVPSVAAIQHEDK